MARWISPPEVGGGAIHALGWNFPSNDYDSESLESNERGYVIWNNVANVLGYVLSPLIGIIRVIVNAVFLVKGDNAGKAYADEARSLLKAQIARGIFEIIGVGPLLFLVDAIVSIGRSCER